MKKGNSYIYLGDKNTMLSLKKMACVGILNTNGKCIRGKNGNMLVEFVDGEKRVVVARLLRKVKE